MKPRRPVDGSPYYSRYVDASFDGFLIEGPCILTRWSY
jgi:hypothetical protein